MKRSEPLRRKAPLKRSTEPLTRSKPLGKGNGRAARARRERPSLRPETCQEVSRRQGGLCACGCGATIAPFPIGYHHVLPKHRWPALIDVTANVIGVAADCHANHETAACRFPWRAILPVLELRLDGPQLGYLERTYSRI